MDKITIYSADLSQSLTLPRVKDVQVGAKEVSNTVKMASGKVVKDMLGYRATITASWDWLPAGSIVTLAAILRENPFLFVEYPSPSGSASGWFEVEYPTMKVFTYKHGEAVWHGVNLSMTAQEVE